MGGAEQAAKKSHRTSRVRFVGEGQREISRERVAVSGGMWEAAQKLCCVAYLGAKMQVRLVIVVA